MVLSYLTAKDIVFVSSASMDFPSFSGHGIPYFQADVLLSQSLGSDPSRSLVLVIDLSPKMDT